MWPSALRLHCSRTPRRPSDCLFRFGCRARWQAGGCQAHRKPPWGGAPFSCAQWLGPRTTFRSGPGISCTEDVGDVRSGSTVFRAAGDARSPTESWAGGRQRRKGRAQWHSLRALSAWPISRSVIRHQPLSSSGQWPAVEVGGTTSVGKPPALLCFASGFRK